MVAELAAHLRRRGWWLACAESCTGGGIAAALTELAGWSALVRLATSPTATGPKQEMLGCRNRHCTSRCGQPRDSVLEMAKGRCCRSCATERGCQRYRQARRRHAENRSGPCGLPGPAREAAWRTAGCFPVIALGTGVLPWTPRCRGCWSMRGECNRASPCSLHCGLMMPSARRWRAGRRTTSPATCDAGSIVRTCT